LSCIILSSFQYTNFFFCKIVFLYFVAPNLIVECNFFLSLSVYYIFISACVLISISASHLMLMINMILSLSFYNSTHIIRFMRLFSANLILPGESRRDDCRATGTPDMPSSVKQTDQIWFQNVCWFSRSKNKEITPNYVSRLIWYCSINTLLLAHKNESVKEI
jgi:hypothetical protein